jgi:hypothetical protein
MKKSIAPILALVAPLFACGAEPTPVALTAETQALTQVERCALEPAEAGLEVRCEGPERQSSLHASARGARLVLGLDGAALTLDLERPEGLGQLSTASPEALAALEHWATLLADPSLRDAVTGAEPALAGALGGFSARRSGLVVPRLGSPEPEVETCGDIAGLIYDLCREQGGGWVDCGVASASGYLACSLVSLLD